MPLGARPSDPPIAIVIQRDGSIFRTLRFLPVKGQAVPRFFNLPAVPAGVDLAGFWYELLSQSGHVLYRGTGLDPLGASIEVPDERGVRRINAPPGSVEFRLLVPKDALLGAARLRIFSLEMSMATGTHPTLPCADLAVAVTEGELNGHV